MSSIEKIEEILESILQDPYFLVSLEYKEGKPIAKLKVLLDGDQGINIDQCARVSRALAEVIESQELITQAYNLEVSSPGVDSPLKMIRQYPQHIGRTVKVKMNDEQEWEGKLLKVMEDALDLDISSKKKKKGNKKSEGENSQIHIPFKDIKESKIVVSFK